MPARSAATAVPVDALFDRRVAHEVALRNLLQRRGHDGVEAVLAHGHAEGRVEGHTEGLAAARREAVRDLCEVLGISVDAQRQSTIDPAGAAELEVLIATLEKSRAWPA